MSILKNTNLNSIICGILYCFPEEVLSIADGRSEYHKIITLVTGKTWKQIYFTPGSADFQEPQKIDDPGSVFEQKLKFVFPGENESNAITISEISNRPILVLLTYNIGRAKFIGDLDNPARLLPTVQTNPKVTNRQMEITCTAISTAKWMDTTGQSIPIPDDGNPGANMD